MELQHVNFKVYVEGDLRLDLGRVVETFHRWVAEQSMDELLVDVADYQHVPAGPGVVLVGLEADYALDNTGDRYGLLYNRKTVVEGSNQDRLRQSLRAATRACGLLESEFRDTLQFSRHELELIVNDRALAPNTPETMSAVKPELEMFLAELGHTNYQLTHDSDSRRRFALQIKLSTPLDWSRLD